MNASRATPHFLSQLADRARYGMDTLVRRDPDPRLPAEPDETVRRSAVLVLVAGSGLDDAQLVLEERGHALRSQPGQFSLPGGKADPTDRDAVHTAEIPMPWRAQRVTPVLAWAPHRPQLRVQDPIEVERLVWAPLTGAGSLTDPRRRMRGILHGQPVGPVFDLPDGALVWGFTAMIVEQVLTGLGLDPVPLDAPVLEIPPERRR